MLFAIVDAADSDIRQTTNVLQWGGGKPGEKKDVSLTAFDACKQLFSRDKTASDKVEVFFSDYELVPLLVFENTAKACAQINEPIEAQIDRAVRTCDAVADASIAGAAVRNEQNWQLLPQYGAMTVRAAMVAGGTVDWPAFPEVLGRMSTTNKRQRQIKEMTAHCALACGTTAGFRLDMLPALRTRLAEKLLKPGELPAAQAAAALRFAQEYGLTRDDVFENIPDFWLPVPGQAENVFEALDSKTKAAFTREFNKLQAAVEPEILEKRGGLKRKRGENASKKGEAREGGSEDEEEELLD